MAFYVKLGTLLVKQVSKPLASQLKSSAVAHPSLRSLLTRLGQRMHEYNAALTQKLKSEGEIATGRKASARACGRLQRSARRNPGCFEMRPRAARCSSRAWTTTPR